jgi:hypothetical protein
MLQAERLRDAAWGCDWVGSPIPFQKCIVTIMSAANKFTLTAGKYVPVTVSTMVNVRLIYILYIYTTDRLCVLVVRVLGYRSGGPGSIPGTTRKKIVGLKRGPLSLVSTTEELLDIKVAAPV